MSVVVNVRTDGNAAPLNSLSVGEKFVFDGGSGQSAFMRVALELDGTLVMAVNLNTGYPDTAAPFTLVRRLHGEMNLHTGGGES